LSGAQRSEFLPRSRCGGRPRGDPPRQPGDAGRSAVTPDPRRRRAPTDDPNAWRRAPTDDPNAWRRAPTDDPNAWRRAPTDDPNARRRAPTDDPNARRRAPTDDPNARRRAPATDRTPGVAHQPLTKRPAQRTSHRTNAQHGATALDPRRPRTPPIERPPQVRLFPDPPNLPRNHAPPWRPARPFGAPRTHRDRFRPGMHLADSTETSCIHVGVPKRLQRSEPRPPSRSHP
jgi:hypothetical protein